MKALWALGFRPFFLFGTIAGSVALLLWVAVFAGWLAWPIDPFWHAHEMIHGFAVAIIIGFLYTASQNWTGVRGIHGRPLMALALLWGAGRLAFLARGLDPVVVALIDLSFLPFATVLLARYLLRADQRHNLMFIVLLTLLWGCNVAYHGERLQLTNGLRASLYLSVHTIIIMILMIAGRVVPFFTERAIAGYTRRKAPALDRGVLLAALAFAIASAASDVSPVTTVLAFITAGLALARFVLWLDRRITGTPILWILYAAYAWVIVGFVLTGLSGLGVVTPTTALHAFTAGAIGTAIIGMVTRVSLGHTGRPIRAARATLVSYILVILASVCRVFGPVVAPEHYVTLVNVAGLAWAGALLIVAATYAPLLLAPRPDGKPG